MHLDFSVARCAGYNHPMEPRDKKNEKKIQGEVEVSRFKGSGPGGQNRNKRETGIRLKHLPSGVTVSATERRSQAQNLHAAYERLENRLEKLSHRPKPRKKSKVKAGAKRKRLDNKRLHSTKKKSRSRHFSDD